MKTWKAVGVNGDVPGPMAICQPIVVDGKWIRLLSPQEIIIGGEQSNAVDGGLFDSMKNPHALLTEMEDLAACGNITLFDKPQYGVREGTLVVYGSHRLINTLCPKWFDVWDDKTIVHRRVRSRNNYGFVIGPEDKIRKGMKEIVLYVVERAEEAAGNSSVGYFVRELAETALYGVSREDDEMRLRIYTLLGVSKLMDDPEQYIQRVYKIEIEQQYPRLSYRDFRAMIDQRAEKLGADLSKGGYPELL